MTKQQATPIQNNVFTVSVSVNADGSGLVFSPDPVQLTNVPNALIVFSLTSPGYYFPVDGSALVICGSNPSAEFPIAWYVNAASIALADFNNNANTYQYTMTVINAANGRPVQSDPSIENDNRK